MVLSLAPPLVLSIDCGGDPIKEDVRIGQKPLKIMSAFQDGLGNVATQDKETMCGLTTMVSTTWLTWCPHYLSQFQ